MLWPIVLLPVLLLVTAATPAEDICSRPLSIAIYAQYESIAKKDMVIPCIENVVAARKIMTSAPPRPMQEQLATPHCVLAEAAFTLDIFVSFSNSIGSGAQQRILGRLGSLQGVSNAVHYTKYFPGFLEAPNAFIFMLNHSHRSIEQYDLSLKIRFGRPLTSKTAKHSVECMCGTPSQVVSIVQGFLSEKAVSAVGPQGFVFTQSSLKRNIAPFIDNDNKKIFNDITMKAVEDVSKSFPGGDGVDHGGGSHVLVIYGGTYWIRPAWMHFSEILPQLEALGANVQDIDQIIDVLLPTLGALGSGQVRAIMPAPKLLPLYFPQYHRIPQNDRYNRN